MWEKDVTGQTISNERVFRIVLFLSVIIIGLRKLSTLGSCMKTEMTVSLRCTFDDEKDRQKVKD